MKAFKKFILTFVILFSATSCTEDFIIPSIPLDLDPVTLANPISLAASVQNKRLYVVNSNGRVQWLDASFIIFDISDPINPVPIHVIPIRNFSGQIILDEARQYVYIPNRKGDEDNDADETEQILRINIDEASPDFLLVEEILSAENPFGAFFDGQNLYVAATAEALRYDVDQMTGYSSVQLDITTNEDRTLDADETREIGISPSGSHIFVTNRIDNMLILNAEEFLAPTPPGVRELGSDAVDYIVVGTASTRGITRDSNFIYLIDGAPAVLKVLTDEGLEPVVGAPKEIPASTLEVASIPVGVEPGQILVDEPNQRAYVTNVDSDDLSIVDLDLQQEVGRIDLSTRPAGIKDEDWDGDQPFGMTLYEINGTQYLYVAHYETNLVSVVDLEQKAVVAFIGDLPEEPQE